MDQDTGAMVIKLRFKNKPPVYCSLEGQKYSFAKKNELHMEI
jgi:hypothetical protein